MNGTLIGVLAAKQKDLVSENQFSSGNTTNTPFFYFFTSADNLFRAEFDNVAVSFALTNDGKTFSNRKDNVAVEFKLENDSFTFASRQNNQPISFTLRQPVNTFSSRKNAIPEFSFGTGIIDPNTIFASRANTPPDVSFVASDPTRIFSSRLNALSDAVFSTISNERMFSKRLNSTPQYGFTISQQTANSTFQGLTNNNPLEFFYTSDERLFANRSTSIPDFEFSGPMPPPAPIPDPADVLLLLKENDLSALNGNIVFVDESSNAAVSSITGPVYQGLRGPFDGIGSLYTTYTGTGGTANCIQFPPNVNYATSTADNYTIEAWVNIRQWSAPSGTRFPIFQTEIDIASSTGKLFMNLSTTGVLFGRLAQTAIQWAFNFNLDTWYHVAVTRQGGTSRAFVNGVELTTFVTGNALTMNNLASSQNGISIGAGTTLGSSTGYISSMRFVKGTALYTSSFTPPNQKLTAVPGTQLLLNFDAAGIIDSSKNVNIRTIGDARRSTVQAKHGTSSIFLDGTGDFVTFPSTEFQSILTGDFTIDGWVYPTNLSGTRTMLVSQLRQTPSSNGFALNSVNGVLRFSFGPAQNAPIIADAGTIQTNTWQHLAVTRQDNTFRVFVNGALTASTVFTGTYTPSTTLYSVGSIFTSTQTLPGTSITPFSGYMDELRIIRVCLFTSNFQPPGPGA
jgi:hypothetical protein